MQEVSLNMPLSGDLPNVQHAMPPHTAGHPERLCGFSLSENILSHLFVRTDHVVHEPALQEVHDFYRVHRGAAFHLCLNLQNLAREFIVRSTRAKGYQDTPITCPVGSTSMRLAAGSAGKPGMVIISPHSTRTKPAPAASCTSETGRVNPLGAPFKPGS